MRFKTASSSLAILLLLIAAAVLTGCGKGQRESGGGAGGGGGPVQKLAPVAAAGAVSVTTRNTARVGGAGEAVDAAAVARVAYPGLTMASRPQAVVLVDDRSWTAALAAAALSSAPLSAPILYAEGDSLPQVTLEALEAMHPTGAPALGGAQVISIGTRARPPARFAVTSVPTADPSSTSAAVERLLARAAGASSRAALVLGTGGPRPRQMPAAGLAAESGAPILLTTPASLSPATSAVLSAMHHPSIYVMNAAGLSRSVLGALAQLGRVTQIPEAGPGETPSASAVAIATARFTDGVFGWGVKEPGHGLVFANAARPLDAPAAALLSATGDYGPLLLLEAPGRIPTGLASYLANIQPAYAAAPEFRPVRGVYNHGWLVGDEEAISLTAQVEIDTLLEISPRKPGGGEEAPAVPAE
jgi:hypothetical protein